MDINYNVATWEVSLQRSCINKVVQCLIEPSWYDCKTTCKNLTETIANVIKKVDCLEIPATLIEDIKEKTGPIMIGIYYWCLTYPFVSVSTTNNRTYLASSCMFKCLSPPVLTNYGSVDPVGTIKALLQQDLDPFEKFLLSVEYCLEDGLLKEGQKLLLQECNSVHKEEEDAWYKISRCWLLYHGHEFMDIMDARTCFRRFEYAMLFNQQVGIKYFIKVPQEEFERIFDKYVDQFILCTDFPPTIYTLLFSRMNARQREKYGGEFAKLMLDKIMCFPYQHLFLQAAQSLVEHISAYKYWIILLEIGQGAAEPFQSYDLVELFVAFWQFGSYEEWDIQSADGQDLIFYILLMKDKRVMNALFTKICKKDFLEYLVEEDNLCIVKQLIHEEEFQLLENILLDCGMDNTALFDTLCCNFYKYENLICRRIRSLPLNSWNNNYFTKCKVNFHKMMARVFMKCIPAPV